MSMPQSRTIVAGGIIVYLILFTLLLPTRLAIDPALTFSNDAQTYHTSAIHIARSGFYSFDGIKPTIGREPGYSFFLAGLYVLFGEGNRTAIFLAQALLHLVATLLFLREFRRISSERTVLLCGAFLLFLPPIFHIIFTVYRESVALSLLLLISAAWLSLRRMPSFITAAVTGIFFGALLITYIPFMFFPLVLFGLCLYFRMRWQHIATLFLIALLFLGAWGTRNAKYGEWTLIETRRTASTWAMRAELATIFSPLDPLRCLLSEYITRNTPAHLQGYCHPGRFAHGAWIREFSDTAEGQIALEQEAKRRILKHPLNYAWHTTVNIFTYHLPYVNGWGFLYNVTAALGTVTLYVGIALFLAHIRALWKKEYLFFLLLILYPAIIFSLTYPVPRYRTPVLFCYAVFASVGYASWLNRPKRNLKETH